MAHAHARQWRTVRARNAFRPPRWPARSHALGDTCRTILVLSRGLLRYPHVTSARGCARRGSLVARDDVLYLSHGVMEPCWTKPDHHACRKNMTVSVSRSGPPHCHGTPPVTL